MYKREFTPEKISELKANEIFVFGSNLAGHHGGGAARVAYNNFGAVWGQGIGLQGQSYAIPTMQGGVDTIKPYVDAFIRFAQSRPDLKFYVTRIGCGIAGFKDEDIAPLFVSAIDEGNILLPREFVTCIEKILLEDETEDEYRDFRFMFRKVFILGQVGHGRTSLANAMSKVLAKRFQESSYYEKIDESEEWNVGSYTVQTSIITVYSDKFRYRLYDEYGYGDEIKLLLGGIDVPDCAIVVVSAEEGIMPQTREVMLILSQLRINKIIIFINKCDKANWGCINKTLNDVRRYISELCFDKATPIVMGSALGALEENLQWEDSIISLAKECDSWYRQLPEKSKEPFAMPIEEVFVTDFGTVAVGKIISGMVHEGDSVEIIGISHTEPLPTIVRGIEKFKNNIEKAECGDCVGLFLGIEKDNIRKGEGLCKPAAYKPVRKFRASLLMLPANEGGRKEPFFEKYRPQCSLYNYPTTCEITITNGSPMVSPGEHVIVDVELLYSLMVLPGMRLKILEGSHLVGIGIVTELLTI